MKETIRKTFQLMKPLDLVVIVVLFVLSFTVAGVVTNLYSTSSTDGIVVQQDGETIFRLSSQELTQDGIYHFAFGNKAGTIEVKNKKVRMLPMERRICPEAICSDTGWIEENPNTIVCLPNKLVVIFTGETDTKIDGIAF